MRHLSVTCVCALTAFASAAGELTVAQDGSGDYETIQAAIDAAKAGDTIWVKPGVYCTGAGDPTTSDPDHGINCKARVMVSKQLNIIATSPNPADTHIVGESDPVGVYAGKTYGGRGTNAVRCVYISAAAGSRNLAQPTIVKGFTIRDGYCRQYANGIEGGDITAGRPGGVSSPYDSADNYYITDCVISNCYGVRGGLARSGNYVRCRFGKGYGNAGQDLGRSLKAMSCLFLHQTGNCTMNGKYVNCTFADATATPFGGGDSSADLYNTIVAESPLSDSTATAHEARNCVLTWACAATRSACHIGLTYQLFAPLRGDFRIRAGTPSETAGDAALIAEQFPAVVDNTVIDLYKSLDGTYFPKTGSIPVGCYATAVAAVGGAVHFAHGNAVTCSGYTGSGYTGGLYAFSETPREVFQVRAPERKTYFNYERAASQGGNQYPEMDESLWVAVPPTGIVVTNTPTFAAAHFYVNPDPDCGNDSNDGTADHPFLTLEETRRHISENVRTVVHCAEGDYNSRCCGDGENGTNRLSILSKNTYVRFKGAGRGKSFISGQPDPYTEDGRGTNAVRCVYIVSGNHVCIQGFTLREGYSREGTEDTLNRSGGLVRANNSGNTHVTDCELVGGVAYRGGCAHGGTFTRCFFRDCNAMGGCGMRNTYVRSSVVFNCTGNFFNAEGSMNHVSFCSTNGNFLASNMKMTNALVYARGYAGSLNGTYLHNVYYDMGSATYTGGTEGENYTKGDPCFANIAAMDFRALACSPTFVAPFEVTDAYWQQPITDLYGVPFNFKNGTVTAGAVQMPVQTVVVAKPAFGSATNVGTNVLEQGESVTVSFTGTSSRHLETVLTNGVPMAGTMLTYTAGDPFAADGSPIAGVVVDYQFSTNWYVNADASIGSDDNDGFTPETPWKTLAKIKTSGYVIAGDCVHVAAGNYVEESIMVDNCGKCRLYVPANVTVVADGTVAETRIVGEGDPTSSDTYKRGSNAVRCAYVNHGSWLIGFTLADGRVANGTTDDALHSGAGICSGQPYTTSEDCGTAYGCVFTNCVAGRGGAAYSGRLINCTILDCAGTGCTAAGSWTAHFGCFVDYCTRGDSTLFRNCYIVSHCTVGPHNRANSSMFNAASYPSVDNTIILTKMGKNSNEASKVFKNCILCASQETYDALKNKDSSCVRIDEAKDAGLGEDCRPLKTSTLVVDNAVAMTTDATCMTDIDLDGTQRIYNGTMDIGAFEYDWRGDYAALLGNVGVVTKADPMVVEKDGKVCLKKGELVLFLPTAGSLRAKYDVPFVVQGDGAFTVTCGETMYGPYAKPTADTVQLAYRGAARSYTFEYTNTAADAGVEFGRISGGVGGTLILIQ